VSEQRKTKCVLWILVGVALLACVGGPIRSLAVRPSPNFSATRQRQALAVAIDVKGVPGREVCARSGGSREVCLSKLDAAFYAGLEPVIGRFFIHDQTGGEVIARMEMIELMVDPAAVDRDGRAMAVRLGMRWRFTMTDRQGEVVAQLADTTVLPRALTNEADVPLSSRLLVETVIERVADAINRLPPPPSTPSQEKSPTTEI
jgi:hypothetical protein